MRRTLEQRLAPRVDCSGGPMACWPWSGVFGQWGVPCLQFGNKNGSARRLIFELAFGPMPAHVKLEMACGRKDCVNPFHMLSCPPPTKATRFWSYVQQGPGCWEWTGHRQRRGYGEFTLTRTTGTPAHRFSWELHFGPIPPGMFVCHHCDNPPCVRPDHLFLGLPIANSRDMVRKGRHSHGPRHGAIVRRAKQQRLRSEPEPGKEP